MAMLGYLDMSIFEKKEQPAHSPHFLRGCHRHHFNNFYHLLIFFITNTKLKVNITLYCILPQLRHFLLDVIASPDQKYVGCVQSAHLPPWRVVFVQGGLLAEATLFLTELYPLPCGQTDTFKNFTLTQTSFAASDNYILEKQCVPCISRLRDYIDYI